MNAPASLTDELLSQLQGAPLQQIASQLGTNPSQAQSAVAAALPMLLGALGRNAAQPQGAADLFGALQRDHVGRAAGGGGLGDLLGSVLGGMGAAVSGLRPMAPASWATFLAATSSVPKRVWARPRSWGPMPDSCCRSLPPS